MSARPKEEVSLIERQYGDGSDPAVLDIIDVPLLRARPRTYQSENWILDPSIRWRLVRRAGWDELRQFADNPETLWKNGASTQRGENDRLPQEDADKMPGSLYLIHVEDLTLHVFVPGADFGDKGPRRVHGAFSHRGVRYRLWMTDALEEARYKRMGDGHYVIGECYLTVSLGEPHDDGFSYKLIAAMIQPPES